LRYILSVGSNIRPQIHVRWVLKQMLNRFDDIYVSRFFRVPAYGMWSKHEFWNGAVMIDSDDEADVLKAVLSKWEEQSGRDRSHPQCSLRDRTLDIDIIWNEGCGWVEPMEIIRSRPYLNLPISSFMKIKVKERTLLKPVYFSLNGHLLGSRLVHLK